MASKKFLTALKIKSETPQELKFSILDQEFESFSIFLLDLNSNLKLVSSFCLFIE
jgi:hypothetical protein